MSQKVKVRPASLEDLPKIDYIERLSFSNPYPLSLLKTLITLNSGEFLVAVLNEDVAGYVASIFKNLSSAVIVSIAVHPKYRGRHIGNTLLKTLIKKLKSKGFLEVELEVRESNIAARRLYEKLGFKYSGEITKYYEDGEDAIIMKLKLT
ncbi:MAG: ribosomal protein S18-alanine N-acetyltransferase [Candidatus Bathyarchaeota archaeon]|nr:ribosomal protein S18-alanine N-acetyltransferase [Candidatus Bathyarchaeota archaeon]